LALDSRRACSTSVVIITYQVDTDMMTRTTRAAQREQPAGRS